LLRRRILFWAAFAKIRVEDQGMALGTSPRPGWTLSGAMTACIDMARIATGGLAALAPRLCLDTPWLARMFAGLHLGGLGVLLMTAWGGTEAAGTTIAGLPALHLAFLMATGAAAAALTLIDSHAVRRSSDSDVRLPMSESGPDGLRDLMAQMSHELRTPLNAVIGFSEVMLRELHGPLGHARYQEYAHHISESGGRLLKSSEDALAVTEAMSVLIADRMQGARERLTAGSLVREAWKGAGVAEPGELRLATTACNTCEIVCERRATLQALEHLLREAAGHAPAGTTIEVRGRRRGAMRSLDIRVAGQRPGVETAGPGSLRVILARLLLETQGARLATGTDATGGWSAVVEFGARG
jgi:signal transduction histidine kinase